MSDFVNEEKHKLFPPFLRTCLRSFWYFSPEVQEFPNLKPMVLLKRKKDKCPSIYKTTIVDDMFFCLCLAPKNPIPNDVDQNSKTKTLAETNRHKNPPANCWLANPIEKRSARLLSSNLIFMFQMLHKYNIVIYVNIYIYIIHIYILYVSINIHIYTYVCVAVFGSQVPHWRETQPNPLLKPQNFATKIDLNDL